MITFEKYLAKKMAAPKKQTGIKKTAFTRWLDKLIKEKGLNTEYVFDVDVDGAFGVNHIPLGVVLEHIKIAPKSEQKRIKNTLVVIDFKNGDIMHFFAHLAEAIAI